MILVSFAEVVYIVVYEVIIVSTEDESRLDLIVLLLDIGIVAFKLIKVCYRFSSYIHVYS